MKTAAFYFGSRILTQVIANTESEAKAKAWDENQITISVNRLEENPAEYKAKLSRARIVWY